MSLPTRGAGCLLATTLLVSGLAAGPAPTGKVEIRVRILHGWSGKPWRGVPVSFWGIKTKGGPPDDAHDIAFRTPVVKTDREGIARLSLREPLPPRLHLFSTGGPDFCTRRGTFSTDEVLHSGVVAMPDAVTCRVKERLLDSAKPAPGEILIFAENNPWP